jgi:hypothetical protein
MTEASEFGEFRPGLHVTPMVYGTHLSRAWSERNLREYKVNPAILSSDANGARDFAYFLDQIGGGLDPFWIVEPSSTHNPALTCGPLGDGSKYTFPMPIFGTASDVTVYEDDDILLSTSYDVRTVANTLDDGTAAGYSTTTYSTTFVTSTTVVTGHALAGYSSVKVVGTGSGNPKVAAGMGPVTAGEKYKVMVAVYEPSTSPRSFKIGVDWYDAGQSYISGTQDSSVAATSKAWTIFTYQTTAVATAAYAQVTIEAQSTSAAEWYVDCFAVCPGDYDRWHLPSAAPNLIEIQNPPDDGQRVTATAYGRRMARCIFDRDSWGWRHLSAGHLRPSAIEAREIVEVDW